MMIWCLLLSAPPFFLALFLDWMREPTSSSSRAPAAEGRVFHAAAPQARAQGRRGAPASAPKLVAARPVERRERAAYRERLASGEHAKALVQPRSLEREARKS